MRDFLAVRNFCLTPGISYDIIIEHRSEARTIHAGVAELVDARDLKSCVPKERAGSTPVSGTRFPLAHPYRGVEQLVARRAHNPEVGGSSPPPATRIAWNLTIPGDYFCLFALFCSVHFFAISL